MTLGQKIQAMRKERGLSQEALGEVLGVSRQAVSKWESDSAIPELDTLIQIGKYFGISVDSLIHPEESSAQSADEEKHMEETPGKISVQIVKKTHPKILIPAACIFAVLLIIVIAVLGLDIYSMKRDMQTMSGQINYLSSELSVLRTSRPQISGSDAFSSVSADVLEVDINGQRVRYGLSASLKEYTEEITGIYIAAVSGGTDTPEKIEVPADGDGVMTCEMWLPMTDSRCTILLDMTEKDGSHRSEIITEANDDLLPERYLPTAQSGFSFTLYPQSRTMLFFGSWQVIPPEMTGILTEEVFSYRSVSGSLDIYIDKALVKSFALTHEAAGASTSESSEGACKATSSADVFALPSDAELDLSSYGGKELYMVFSVVDAGDRSLPLDEWRYMINIKDGSLTLDSIQDK